jgi:hypothetical protein
MTDIYERERKFWIGPPNRLNWLRAAEKSVCVKAALSIPALLGLIGKQREQIEALKKKGKKSDE